MAASPARKASLGMRNWKPARTAPTSSLGARIWKNRQTYILLLPGLVWYVIFAYLPMGGLTLAFKDYKANLGILGSPWVGLQNYEFVFRDPEFYRALKNTIVISLQRLLFQFPVPIVLALLINELRMPGYKRVLQTVYTFPHFLSWVIVASVMFNVFEYEGLLNGLIKAFGGENISFLSSKTLIRPILYITESWKAAGWSAIIYMAAISGIDLEQYEAAMIDGASRFQRIIYITLPGIRSTIMVLLILAVGGIMNAGFDQIFNLTNATVREVADILDTYIYRITFQTAADFSFSTAIALFKSVVNFIMLILTDRLAKWIGGSGLFA